jgi:hypothetical protein
MVELRQVHFTLRLRDQRSIWMQDGCKVYMDSYMAPNGSCFMVTWVIFRNHLLEVGLTQNRETMALRNFTTIEIILFYHVWGLTWIEIHWNSIWLRAQLHMSSCYTWETVIRTTWFWKCLGDGLLTLLLGSPISWSQLLVRVWVALRPLWQKYQHKKLVLYDMSPRVGLTSSHSCRHKVDVRFSFLFFFFSWLSSLGRFHLIIPFACMVCKGN